MKGYLLDTNLLIALFWPSHTRHDLAIKWFTRQRAKGWATCPFTQAGFVRIVSNPAFSRDAPLPREALHVLSANTSAKDHAFWTDALGFGEAVAFASTRLMGHQQVTDAYLLGLAIHHGGVMATLDQKIEALTQSKSAERKALELVN
jgi:toxin-antitoxin system PIN domain toxin